MFISETVQDAINDQIQAEIYSAYLYLSMSAHFEAQGFPGFANWTRLQFEEEMEHAMKFFNYVNERGGRVVLQAIQQPPVEWGTPLEIFQEILAHEQKVTALIHELYEVALKENDYPTQVMLHWFIEEQVEEEANAGQLVDRLEMVAGQKMGIMQLDHIAGARQAG